MYKRLIIKIYKPMLTILLISFLFFINLSNSYAQVPDPYVYCPACILMDLASGKILYSKNANEKMYPASTTKVMTAILTLENCKLTETATVSKTAISSVPNTYATAYLKEDEQFTVEQLLNVLLIPSANDAAFVLAEHVAGTLDSFYNMMNLKAQEIGCKNTHFVNPNGIHDDDHYSTAYDLALIGKYAMKFPEFRSIVSKTSYTLPDLYNPGDRVFNTTNELIKKSSKYYYEYATGAKTGYTVPANHCIIATAKKDNMELLAVVLKDEITDDGLNTRPIDCKTLFEYGFNNYSISLLVKSGTTEKTILVSNATKDTKSLDLITNNDLNTLIPNDYDKLDITPNITLNSNISAPISQGDVLGSVSFTADGTTYKTDLIASHSVEKYDYTKLIVELLLVITVLTLFSMILKKHNKKSSKKSKKNTKKKKKHFSSFDSNFYPRYK